jgi:hypothetical protein
VSEGASMMACRARPPVAESGTGRLMKVSLSEMMSG